MHELQQATSQGEQRQDMIIYWSFQDDMAVIDGIILKGTATVPYQSYGNWKKK